MIGTNLWVFHEHLVSWNANFVHSQKTIVHSKVSILGSNITDLNSCNATLNIQSLYWNGIPGSGVWSSKLLSWTMKVWGPRSTPLMISLAVTTAWVAVCPTSSRIIIVTMVTSHWHNSHVPAHHFVAVRVGESKTNSCLDGSYVAVVSSPRIYVPTEILHLVLNSLKHTMSELSLYISTDNLVVLCQREPFLLLLRSTLSLDSWYEGHNT